MSVLNQLRLVLIVDTTMAKRVVINTSLYYNENVVNYVAVHPNDSLFSQTNRVEILNKDYVIEFEVILSSTVTQGAVALNRYGATEILCAADRSGYLSASAERGIRISVRFVTN